MNRKLYYRSALIGSLFFIFMSLLLTNTPARALDSSDLSFYAPFDDSLNAVFAKGKAVPETTVGQYEFAPGVLGKAVITGEQGKELSYGVDNNFPDRQGSISIWIKLVDWGAVMQDHLLLSIPEKLLLHYASNSGGVHLVWPNIGGNTYSYPPSLNKDKFVHLVYTWGNGKVTLYGNGQYVRDVGMNQPPYFPASFKELPQWTKGLQFYLSNPVMTKDGKNKTILDELMLFNRPLDATEVKSLYRHLTVSLPETTAAIGEVKNAPKIDGVFSPEEWKQTAQLVDFVDRPFGNLSPRPVTANIAYDQSGLYLALRSPAGKNSQENSLEIQLLPKDAKDPYRFVVTADQKLLAYLGSSTAPAEIPWQAKASESCFEAAIPWSSIGLTNPPEGTSVKINILRRWSPDYKDFASWSDAADPARYGTILLAGKSPILAMDSLGKLNYAQFDLSGKVINPSGTEQALNAEVRLQPSDLKEYYDPKTLPGTKSYTGTQIILDQAVKSGEKPADLRVTSSFSDTDINSLYLKVTGPAGNIIYQAQRTFVAQPPIIVSTKTYPDHDRLEVTADISYYRESPPDTLRAEVQLIAPSGQVVNTARIEKFESNQQVINLPLAPLPTGIITVKTTLWKSQTRISSFLTSFEKVAPGPWYNNTLGKDDIVIPPFTPVKVSGQSVSVWGRTYKWNNSLFPVQVTSAGEELLANPMELVAGGTAANKPNPAQVKVVEQKDTRAIVECTGEIAGVPVTARHTIEYDGMCLTQLRLSPRTNTPVQFEKLSLLIPYRRTQAELYSTTLDQMVGTVGEKTNLLVPPMNNGRDFQFENTVWLGNEDRGMTWFAEDGKGWRFKENGAPLGIHATESSTLFTVQFAKAGLEFVQPLTLTFGIIATPVKPMRDGWRFMRQGRNWTYGWYEGFTASNNDIANPSPLFKYSLDKMRLIIPKFAPYYDSDKPLSFSVPYQAPQATNTKQPEATYYGQEWMISPRSTWGNDIGSPDRHLAVCLGSKWQDFMVYYAVKAYNDLNMDGYYFDGAGPSPCKNVLHGHGWTDDLGNLHPTYTILACREFFKRLQVEFFKSGRPSLIFAHMSGFIEMPSAAFYDMQWNGENFSTRAVPSGDYNKLISLAYFRTVLLGQPFGITQQWLAYSSDNKGLLDSILELSLVHGAGDLSGINNPYTRGIFNAQDDFGVQRKDCTFLPYWKNSKQVTVEPADENLVCSIWQRPGKVLLILANSTKDDQEASIRLNLSALGLKGTLKATDLISKEAQPIEAGVVKAKVARSNWRLIVVEGDNAGNAAVQQPEDLFHAVQKGDLAKVTEFLSADASLLKAKDIDGYTALHFAAFNNRKEVAAYLLEKGADTNAKCRFGFTPLHLAASACYKDIVEMLLAKGADVNARANSGATPLHLAVSVPLVNLVPANYTETATLLIQKGADVNAKDGFGRTPLFWLVNWHISSSEQAMAELLIANGADVNARDNRNWTPLHTATTKQYFADPTHPALAEVLRKHGGKE